MTCEQCGTEIPDDLYFCPDCGTKRESMSEQEDPDKNEKPEKKGKSRFLLWGVLGAVVVIAIIIVIALFVGNRKNIDRIDYKNYIECVNDSYFLNMEGSRYSTDIENYLYSADYSIAAYTVYEGDNRTLYYIDSSLEPKRVAEDVLSYAISYTGEYIAYVEEGESEVSGTLYLYCIEKDKSKKIDEEVYPDYLCLSPTGKAVAYIRDFENEDDFCLYLGGIKIKNREVSDDNCVPIALTDNGKTLYYVNDNYRLYMYDGKESEKLASGVSLNFFFNKDLSELIFSEDGNTYYYTRKMDEPIKICGNETVNMVAGDITCFSVLNGCSNILGLDTLKGSVLYTDKGIYWLNREGTDTAKISNSAISGLYQISEDGKSAICLMNDGLYEIEKLDDNMEAKLLYDEKEIEYVVANANLSRIYLVIDGELHYLKGKNKTEELTDDIEASTLAAYHEGAKQIFFITDGTLYQAGTKEKSVKEVAGENIVNVYTFADGIVYWAEEEGKVYAYYIDEAEQIIELGIY